MKRLLIIVLILALVFTLAVGCKKKEEPIQPPQEQENPQEQESAFEEREILLFYPDQNNNFLLPEFRKVTVQKDIETEDLARLVLEELISGTENSQLKCIVPRNAKLLSVDVYGESIELDFSEDFIVKSYTKREKLLQVFSVVNTLSELGLEEVVILVDGKPVSDIYTSIEYEMPYLRNDELMPSK
ncbi:MAG: hypothetical protein HPY66_1151 [Firmicutes bacterium]|nr:hypothetical protein [Bacillota bacterium]MDI6705523.1 GerMN domain-containing protein [Bacillota bacterium]